MMCVFYKGIYSLKVSMTKHPLIGWFYKVHSKFQYPCSAVPVPIARVMVLVIVGVIVNNKWLDC